MLPALCDIEPRLLPAQHLCGGELGCAGDQQGRHVEDLIESTTRLPRHVCLAGVERLIPDLALDPDAVADEPRHLRRQAVLE